MTQGQARSGAERSMERVKRQPYSSARRDNHQRSELPGLRDETAGHVGTTTVQRTINNAARTHKYTSKHNRRTASTADSHRETEVIVGASPRVRQLGDQSITAFFSS